MGRTPWRQDDHGAMLLLTAFILAMGFIALASMAARVEQIPDQAELIQEDNIFDELELVSDGVAATMDGLAGEGIPLANVTFVERLEGALSHLAFVEQGRGFYVAFGASTCTVVGSDARLEVPVRIASINDEVSFTVSRTYEGATCA